MRRSARIEGEVAYIPLTQGYEAVIDATDLHLLGGFNWCADPGPHTTYAGRTDRSGPRQRLVLMHRLIMGNPDGLQVDHIDGNGLNNRRENLRLASREENQRNRRLNANNTSGFKGVSWSNSAKKWHAYIKAGGKRKHLGFYASAEEAHAVYCAASKEFHGQFGRTF